jgi:hypothetical protein
MRDCGHQHPLWHGAAAWGLAGGIALGIGALILVSCGVQIGVFYRAVAWASGEP